MIAPGKWHRNWRRRFPGVRAIDGGKLENARIVESMTALLITLNIRYKVHGVRVEGDGAGDLGPVDREERW